MVWLWLLQVEPCLVEAWVGLQRSPRHTADNPPRTPSERSTTRPAGRTIKHRQVNHVAYPASRGPTQQTQTHTDRRARAVFYLRCFPSLINNARMRSKAGRSRKGDLKVYSNNNTHTNTHPVPANLITPEGIYLADTSFTLFQSANKNIFHVRVDARAPKPLIYVENQSEAGVLSEPNGFANCCRQTLIRLQTNP